MYELIGEAAEQTSVLPRSQDNLAQYLRDFTVAIHQDRIVGCGALNVITRDLAEIRTVVVAPAWRGHGVGRLLVQRLVEEARQLQIQRVFALTDHVPFFERLGFRLTPKSTLPHKIWTECVYCPKFHHCPEQAVDLLMDPPEDA